MSLFTVKSNGAFLSVFSDFTSLFFPEYCLGCYSGLVKGEDILCTRCLLNLPRAPYFQFDDNRVKDKFVGRLPLKYAFVFLQFRKEGIVQRLLHQLKYNNHPEIGTRLGKLFGYEIRSLVNSEFDFIVPLPLHSSRLRRRGYNQSSKFAEGISEVLNIPFSNDACVRSLNTSTQTRKTKSERWENVSEAFSIPDISLIRDRRILLVDDVITTGATLEACGQQLLNAGCKELSIACIAEAQ